MSTHPRPRPPRPGRRARALIVALFAMLSLCFGPTSTGVGIAHAIDEPGDTLRIIVRGDGNGTVTDAVPGGGIHCPNKCAAPEDPGTVITLTATPAPFSRFAGWSGGCAGFGPCTFTFAHHTDVIATFLADQTERLTITPAGTAVGTIVDTHPGGTIHCPPRCSSAYPQGTVVTLEEFHGPGSEFTGWHQDGCDDHSNHCTVVMSFAVRISPWFSQH